MKQLREHDLFIGGRAARGRGEKVITVINPATEEPIAAVPTASADDTKAAIAAAHRAFADGQGPWPAMPPRERSKILHRFCDLLEANVAELCQIARAEIGSTQMLDAVQVHWGIRQTRYWAEQAATFRFEEPLPPVLGELGGAGQSVIFKEPIGVVAAITPFNFPILLNLWKIGPALAMGNTMVLKPSPYTPLSALILARLAAEAGLPEGVLNVVVGDAEVGEILTTHPDVAMVSFTGSDTVGARIMAQAAGTIKRVVLELGGKSANIVFADVDLDNPKVMASLLSYVTHCGQGCGLPTRILAEQSIYDEVVRRMSAALAGIKVGDPADPTVMMGPLIRAAQRDRVEKYVSIGLSSAKLMRLSDHLDLRNQSGSMYFHEFLRPRKLEHVLGVMIRPSIPRLPVVVLGFQRAGKRPDFSENDLKFVRLLTSSLVSRVENFALHNLVQEMKRNSATASDERQTFEITLDSPHRLKVYSRHSANEASFIYSPSISYYPGLQHTMKSVCGRTVPAKDILCFLSSIGLSSVPESYQVHISPVLDKNASVKYILVAEPPQQESPVMSWAREYKMTARELEIVACIVEGLRNAEIAEKLQLSIRTVENHLRSIFSKAAVSSRTQLLHQLLVTNNVKATELRVM